MESPKGLDQLFSRIVDNSNLIAVSQDDIDNVTRPGTEVSLKPRKNGKAKGVIIFLDGTTNMTLDKLGTMAGKITKPLPKNTKILWGARIDKSTKKDKLEAAYVY